MYPIDDQESTISLRYYDRFTLLIDWSMMTESAGRAAMVVNLWASLAYGLVLILAPDLFCEILRADAVNTAWLRTIGAALLGTNVLGSWLWLRNPGLDMGRVQTATAGLEAAAMAASLLLGEFTADNIWMVHASVLLALIVTIGLLPTAMRKSYNSSTDSSLLGAQIDVYMDKGS